MASKLRLELFIRGITATDVAKKAGVSVSFAARCINGKVKPSVKITKALANITGLPEKHFKGDSNE